VLARAAPSGPPPGSDDEARLSDARASLLALLGLGADFDVMAAVDKVAARYDWLSAGLGALLGTSFGVSRGQPVGQALGITVCATVVAVAVDEWLKDQEGGDAKF
jgi:hypothetical protein